ncbi:hypothetical protein ABEB36_000637 [Hypothenemus hampei]|uniref:Uncharacterized protein n=1 Tax=Hypothenemus hampei TaxID=57062 RepID=A0ABD1FBX4_HYPHA
MLAFPVHLIVLIFHSQIQLLQLLDKIKKFEKNISNENMDDEWILKNLKIIGQHHLDIKRYYACILYTTSFKILQFHVPNLKTFQNPMLYFICCKQVTGASLKNKTKIPNS